MNRKHLLFALVLIFLGALAYAWTQTPKQKRVTNLSAQQVVSHGTIEKKGVSAQRVQVRLELLNREVEPYTGARRDIFAPLDRPPAAAPTPPAPAPSSPPPLPSFVAYAAPLEEVQEEPSVVRRELASFKYLGFLLKEGKKTVFLGTGDDLFVVRKGTRFGEKKQFLVAELSPERLIIHRGEDSTPITVPLVEQQPLVPASVTGGSLGEQRGETQSLHRSRMGDQRSNYRDEGDKRDKVQSHPE
jgi:hypothetical protein